MKTFLAALLLLSASPALAHEGCDHPDAPKAATAPAATKDGVVLRGEKLPATSGTPVTELLAKPASFEGKSVVVEGEVRRACSAKGCWMELAPTAKAAGAGVRVTFKDYGFFVPTDSAGSHARVAGVVKVSELSAELTRHYEGEGATVPRGADGKPREVQLVATGVELRR
jgi:hypothetical protein